MTETSAAPPATPIPEDPESEHLRRDARTAKEMKYHPAFEGQVGRTLPAGKVIVVVAIALSIGLLFNSAWVVSTGQGMKDGLGRSFVLGVGEPVNAFAASVGLTKPKEWLDTLFGHPPLEGGEALVDGSDDILSGPKLNPDGDNQPGRPGTKPGVKPSGAPTEGPTGGPTGQPSGAPTAAPPGPVEPPVKVPTVADPLNVLVIGDSLSTYPAFKIESITYPSGRVSTKYEFRDGTGLTSPEVINWLALSKQLVSQYQPDAVVMIIGGNDRLDMERNGKLLTAGSPEWEQEYARRVAVIMTSMIDEGVQRVYWGGPPVARSEDWNRYYKVVNEAIAEAVQYVPGTRYVDLYDGTSDNGVYQEDRLINGQMTDARQSDGIHWNEDGSVEVAQIVVRAMAQDYGNLRK